MSSKIEEVKLSEESFNNIMVADKSIKYWSVEHGKLTLQLEGHKSQLFVLYENRRKLIEAEIEKAGFKMDNIIDIEVTGDGVIKFSSKSAK